jgi:hypothetical protein
VHVGVPDHARFSVVNSPLVGVVIDGERDAVHSAGGHNDPRGTFVPHERWTQVHRLLSYGFYVGDLGVGGFPSEEVERWDSGHYVTVNLIINVASFESKYMKP